MSSLKKFYSKNGFVILPQLLSFEEVQNFRKEIAAEFKRSGNREALNTREILEKIPLVKEILLKEKLINTLKDIFDHDFSYSNGLGIQKNNTNLLPTDGWHEDVQSQKLMKRINKNLDSPQYQFCKVGIFLQNDTCPFGSSIEIIPGSHKFNRFIKHCVFVLLFKRVLGAPLRSLFTKKLDKVLHAGDAVIFDSHLIHRSSLIRDPNLKQMVVKNLETLAFYSTDIEAKEQRDLSANVEDYKFAIYFEGGNVQSCKQYQRSNLVRALIDEVGVSEAEQKIFSDCLSMSSDLYPQDFLKTLKDFDMDIQFLENEKHRKIAEKIYLNCLKSENTYLMGDTEGQKS